MSALLAVLLDAAVVVAFAAAGRRTHAEGLDLAGIAATAWPFLVGAALGWAGALALLDGPPRSLGFGAVVLLTTVIVGMGLRVAVGQGTAPSFVVVAFAVLAVGLLGWRLVARAVS